MRACTILEQDLPSTPLYREHEAVVIDSRLCGAHPQVMWDLSWLADVHPCAAGEAP